MAFQPSRITIQNSNSKLDSSWRTLAKVPPKDSRIKTSDVTATKGTDFEDYITKTELMMGIVEKGFDKPSPIQEECFPVALAGIPISLFWWSIMTLARKKPHRKSKERHWQDCCFRNSNPWTFGYLQENNTRYLIWVWRARAYLSHYKALILVPTRELALQVSAVVKELGKYLKVESMVSTGGTSLREDILRLNSPVHVVVGTPGRILDLATRGIANLSNCDVLALDEADKLLSVDFGPVVENLLKVMPQNLQIMAFSATFPQRVQTFQEKFMPDCRVINLMDELTLKGVTQYYVFLEERQKVHCLNALFSKVNSSFCDC